jgi:RIO kinase 1
MARIQRFSKEAERFKIQEGVFDEYTMKTLIKLSTKGYFHVLDYPISTGKEADVYRATKRSGKHVAIKIYRIETTKFRSMWPYLHGDPRFSRIGRSRRAIITAWCQKEYRNLLDAGKAGVNVPKPHKFMNNVLILDFIGEGGIAASLLKDVKPKDPEKLIRTLQEYIKKLWQKGGIVHSDLSEFNIMLLNEKPVLIDIGQAVSKRHPRAHDFLKRDIHNLARYAKKYGVKIDEEKLYNSIV